MKNQDRLLKAKEHKPGKPATQTIDHTGGKLRVGEHILDIPKGAIRKGDSVEITFAEPKSGYIKVTVKPKDYTRYDFVSGKPATLTLDCKRKDESLGKDEELRIFEIDEKTDTIKGKPEKGPKPGSNKVSAYLTHISGYAVGGGRAEA